MKIFVCLVVAALLVVQVSADPDWIPILNILSLLSSGFHIYDSPCDGYFIVNAHITTFDSEIPTATMLRTAGDKISWVGSSIVDYLLQAGNQIRPCRIINAAGKRVGPAIWDSHVHILRAGIEGGCQIYGAETAFTLTAWLNAISAGLYLCNSTETVAITGGFSLHSIGGTFPTIAQLDTVVPNQPFIATQRYNYTDVETLVRMGPGVTNTKGRDFLNAAGFGLAADGTIPQEKTNNIILYLRSLMTLEDRINQYERMFNYLLSLGIIGGLDMPGGQFTVPDDYDTIHHLYWQQEMNVAIGLGLLPYLLPGGIEGTVNNTFSRLGAARDFSDAVWQAGFAEYWFNTVALGNETQLTAALEIVRESNQKDEWMQCLNVEFPSNAPGTLAALENILGSHGIPPYVWSLEHAIGFNESALQFLDDNKIFLSVDGGRFLWGQNSPGFQGPPLRTALAISDDPLVAINTDARNAAPLDWWIGAQFLVDGTNVLGQVINADETIPILDVYRYGSVGTARKVRQDHIRGSLTAGKLADLVIWEQDPLTVATNQIHLTTAQTTFFRGRIVYED